MAAPAFKLDPRLKPLSDSLRGSLNSQTGRISSAFGKALGGSGVHGEGFKKVKEKLQDVSEQMAQATAEEIEAGTSLEDAFDLIAMSAFNEAANANIEEALADEVAQQAAAEAANNLDPNQAIGDFGKSALPEAQNIAEQIAAHDAEQQALASALQNGEPANDNVEMPTPSSIPPQNGKVISINRNKEKSEAARQQALNAERDNMNREKEMDDYQSRIQQEQDPRKKEALQKEYLDFLDKEIEKMQRKQKEREAQNQEAAKQKQQISPSEEQSNQEAVQPEQKPETPEPINKEPEKNLDEALKKVGEMKDDAAQEAEKANEKETEGMPELPREIGKEPATQTNPPEPEPQEKPNKIDQALNDAGVPLVDTDEDNPMLPKKTEAEKAKEKERAEAAGNNPNSKQGEDEGQDEETEARTPQKDPRRGIITQGVNSLKNRERLKEITNETNQLHTNMEGNRKKIEDINNKIGPEESKIKKLEKLNKLLKVIVPILFVISLILSLFSLVLGWVLVILPGLSTAASLTHKYLKKIRKKNEEEIEKIKAEIKKPLDERATEYKKLSANTKQVETLARERFRLKNQSLIGRNPK